MGSKSFWNEIGLFNWVVPQMWNDRIDGHVCFLERVHKDIIFGKPSPAAELVKISDKIISDNKWCHKDHSNTYGKVY